MLAKHFSPSANRSVQEIPHITADQFVGTVADSCGFEEDNACNKLIAQISGGRSTKNESFLPCC